MALGATWTDDFDRIPPSMRYFAGGDRSIRGYAFENIGSRDAGDNNIGGRYLAVGSLEYEYYFKPDWAAAAFIDAGDAYINDPKSKSARARACTGNHRSARSNSTSHTALTKNTATKYGCTSASARSLTCDPGATGARPVQNPQMAVSRHPTSSSSSRSGALYYLLGSDSGYRQLPDLIARFTPYTLEYDTLDGHLLGDSAGKTCTSMARDLTSAPPNCAWSCAHATSSPAT